MIKRVKEFLQKAEGKKVRAVWTWNHKLTGTEKTRKTSNTNLLYNMKSLKEKEHVQTINGAMEFKFENMQSGAIYSIVD